VLCFSLAFFFIRCSLTWLGLEKATGSFGLIGAIDLHTGQLVRTLCDHTGKVSKVSEVFVSSSPEHQSHVFLGMTFGLSFIVYRFSVFLLLFYFCNRVLISQALGIMTTLYDCRVNLSLASPMHRMRLSRMQISLVFWIKKAKWPSGGKRLHRLIASYSFNSVDDLL
jgi:hypothetical protein